MKKPKFQTPSGVHDILPEDYKYYQKIEQVAASILSFYGFSQMETPIFEDSALFSKGIGLATEIVQKQMYTFKTKGDHSLTLRPEATSSIVRAYIQHGMQSWPHPVKLWCFGPFYRYERPQAGRYRQFYQLNLEVLGEQSPAIDAQVIQIFLSILQALKIKDLVVKVNSIGDSQCRPYYKKLLTTYFKGYKAALCGDCKRRLKENPLRILDCKREKCQRIVKQAPQIIDHLCKECKGHFRELLEFLDEMEVPYVLDPYLVRGLDYYTKTVFEIFSKDPDLEEEGLKKERNALVEGSALSPASSFAGEVRQERQALVGGGRYDNLVKVLGGRETPGCGGALGVERVVDLIKEKDLKVLKESPPPQVFLAQLGRLAQRKSLGLLEEFRKARIDIAQALGRDSLRAQLRIADRQGVKYVLILGQKEALEGEILIRDMKTGKQKAVKMSKVIGEVRKRLRK